MSLLWSLGLIRIFFSTDMPLLWSLKSHVLTFSRSHALTFSRSHILTFSHSHILTFSHSHVLTLSRSHEKRHPAKHRMPFNYYVFFYYCFMNGIDPRFVPPRIKLSV